MSGKMLICDDIVGTFFKKYKCVDCKVKLKRTKASKTVNARSEEAKKYSFHIYGNTVTGDVKIFWYEFKCPVCKKCFTVEQLEEIKNKNSQL